MSTRRHRGRIAFFVICLALSGGCHLSDQDFGVVEAWLTCDECLEGEREAVAAQGSRLVMLLSTALVDGPSAARRQLLRQKFIAAFPPLGVAGISADTYADSLVANYVAGFQERAAVSLSDIGGSRAMQALDRVLASPGNYRRDVVATVDALRSAMGATPFSGTLRPKVVRFGDTVFLYPPLGQPFTGDEFVTLTGAGFDSTEILLDLRPDQLAFAAVGEEGFHHLRVTSVGNTTRTESATLSIISVADRNDRRMLACTTFACRATNAEPVARASMPYQTFLALHRKVPSPDTLDYFRFEPSVDLPVTARLQWPAGSDSLDLTWRRCGVPNALVGNLDGATPAANPEITSVTVPAGECWLLLVSLSSTSARSVFARLLLRSP